MSNNDPDFQWFIDIIINSLYQRMNESDKKIIDKLKADLEKCKTVEEKRDLINKVRSDYNVWINRIWEYAYKIIR